MLSFHVKKPWRVWDLIYALILFLLHEVNKQNDSEGFLSSKNGGSPFVVR